MTSSLLLSRIVELVGTYLVHSTACLLFAWGFLSTASIRERRHGISASKRKWFPSELTPSLVERTWKLAAVLALMTAPLSIFAGGFYPAWRWSLYDQLTSKIETIRSDRPHREIPDARDPHTRWNFDQHFLMTESSTPEKSNSIERSAFAEWPTAAEATAATNQASSAWPTQRNHFNTHDDDVRDEVPAMLPPGTERAPQASPPQETRIEQAIRRWIAGIGVLLFAWIGWTASRLALRIFALHRLLARCLPIGGELRRELNRLTPEGYTIRLLRGCAFRHEPAGSKRVNSMNEPFACRMFCWTIVLPEWIERELSPAEQKALLAHEVAHLVRRDPLWLFVGEILCTCFAFQPLNFVARHRWHQASEFLCDDWAVEQHVSATSLASCLTRIAESRFSGRVTTGGLAAVGPSGSLTHRVRWLLRSDRATEPRRDRGQLLAPLLVISAGLIAGICGPQVSFVPTVQAGDPAEEPVTWNDIYRDMAEVLEKLDQIGSDLPDDPEAAPLVESLRSQAAALKLRLGQ